MRLLFLGDIVGRAGRNVVCDALPGLIKRYALDFVVINGENSAGGFGITEAILTTCIDAGADCRDARQPCVRSKGHARLHRAS